MQVHPYEKTKRKDFIHPTIDKLNEARKWRCMVRSRLHGYFKDSLTLCYRIQSTTIAIICITTFLVWLSCFLIRHEWDNWAWCTSNQVWYFWLFCSPRRHISVPVWKKKTRLTPFSKKQNTFVTGNDIAHSLRSWVFDKTVCWNLSTDTHLYL